jgi:ribokinase
MGDVVVAGSINMDVVVTASRHPRLGETVAGESVLYFPGGKGANQAVAAAKLGAPTRLIGRVGRDSYGSELKAYLAAQGVDVGALLETPAIHTGTAIITLANADNTIVVVHGANAALTAADIAALPLAAGDVAVSQFEIPAPTIAAFFVSARTAGATTILNPAPVVAFDRQMLDLVDILVLNETELGILTGVDLRDTDDPSRFVEAARSLAPGDAGMVCVTLGARGVVALVGGETVVIPGRVVKAVDTTGAGDCFIGALAARVAAGHPIRDALMTANIAASLCVQRMGAAPSMPTADEVAAATRD